MKIELNISKKHLYIITAIFVVFAGLIFAIAYTQQIPNPGHGADTVLVSVNGQETSLQTALDSGNIGGSSVFTRWGNIECPTGTEKVYDGYVAGEHASHSGGGANTLCLTKTPTWLNYSDVDNNGNLIYGTEYQTSGYGLTKFLGKNDYEAPCAVCVVKKSTVFMHPGSKDCPAGWTNMYYGYLMANHYTQYKSETVCVDETLTTRGSNTNLDGNLWYPTEAECGSLPCASGGYVQNRELTCSVCAK